MRQIKLLLFGSLLLLTLSQDTNQCKIEANGCSVPLNLPFIFKKTFTPACIKHDVCYYCGEHYGWQRRQDCDEAFKKDMGDLCDGISRRKRWFFPSKVKRCKKARDLYYAAVSVAGKFYWANPSPSWCEESCAKDRGDPKRLLAN